jgi:YaiO family outer membrane protein
MRSSSTLLAAFAAAHAAAFAGPALAQAQFTEIEAGFSRESLTGARPDWKSRSLDLAHTFQPRRTLYGMLRETERFGLRDTELSLGYYHPLSADWTALVEASHSPQHNVLPRHSAFGQLAWQAAPGWVLSAGLRHSEYTRTDTNLLVAGIERYWGSFRAGYTLYNGRPEGAGSGAAHRLSLDYYYGERNRIGFGFTTGREVENVGPPLGIASTEVKSYGLIGRHWLTPRWALTWDLTTHEQGNLYRRDGFRLGLRHRF